MNYQADRFTVLADACVLASVLKRNMLLSLAEAQAFRIRWSVTIMDETEKAIAKLLTRQQSPDPKENAKRQRGYIEDAFEESTVTDFKMLQSGLTGINAKDRHVLAAAIKTSASVIVTDNLKDFDRGYCAQFDIEPLSADSFIADCIELSPTHSIAVLRTMRQRFKNPKITPDKLIVACESASMLKTASFMLDYKDSL